MIQHVAGVIFVGGAVAVGGFVMNSQNPDISASKVDPMAGAPTSYPTLNAPTAAPEPVNPLPGGYGGAQDLADPDIQITTKPGEEWTPAPPDPTPTKQSKAKQPKTSKAAKSSSSTATSQPKQPKAAKQPRITTSKATTTASPSAVPSAPPSSTTTAAHMPATMPNTPTAPHFVGHN